MLIAFHTKELENTSLWSILTDDCINEFWYSYYRSSFIKSLGFSCILCCAYSETANLDMGP